MNESSSRALTSRTVSRAVARSRAVRARLARRRRRTAALLACIGAVVGLPIAWSMAEPAGAVLEAAVTKAQDLADLLNERSPGARTQDQLTKHARALAKAHVHPKLAAPAGHPLAPEAPTVSALVDLLQPPVVPVEIASADIPPSIGSPPTLASIIGSTPGFTPPGNDTIGTQTLPSPEPREVVPPTSAVPEPGTWAMMLTGFGLIAWRIRRRRRPLEATKRALS